MTRDIKAQLETSDAFAVLQMEQFVERKFIEAGWETQRSVFYSDRNTSKLREIDVLATKTYSLKRPKAVETPIINFSTYCECKSLVGWHIIVADDDVASEQMEISFWIGRERHTNHIFRSIVEQAEVHEKRKMKAIYDYLVDRSHPGLALTYDCRLNFPPVDVFSKSYKETNTKDVKDENASVIWKAALTLFGLMKLDEERSLETAKGYIAEEGGLARYGKTSFISSAAFFYDAELMRVIYNHSVLFVKSQIWCLRAGRLERVESVRLHFSHIHDEPRYIDLVDYAAAEKYISRFCAHIDEMADTSVRKLWKRQRRLQFYPGQSAARLSRLLRTPGGKSTRKQMGVKGDTQSS
jgi:hypothetical protein